MKTNVIRGGVPILVRDVSVGGNHCTEAIARRLQVPFEMAEAAKLGANVGLRREDLAPALESVSRELALEIQRTFDYFASTPDAERIGRIVLSGGGARLAGLGEVLSSSWGIPVEQARPFKAIQVEPARLRAEGVEQVGPTLAVAVGLALRAPGGRPA